MCSTEPSDLVFLLSTHLLPTSYRPRFRRFPRYRLHGYFPFSFVSACICFRECSKSFGRKVALFASIVIRLPPLSASRWSVLGCASSDLGSGSVSGSVICFVDKFDSQFVI